MIDTKHFNSATATVFKSFGYRRAGTSWSKRSDQAYVAVQFQKSNYDRQLFINVGINILALGGAVDAAPQKCQLYARLEDVIDQKGELHELFDLASDKLSAEEHAQALISYLRVDLLPRLEPFLDVRHLRDYFANGKLGNVAMTAEAIAFLENTSEETSKE
jgi:hypothetical protein